MRNLIGWFRYSMQRRKLYAPPLRCLIMAIAVIASGGLCFVPLGWWWGEKVSNEERLPSTLEPRIDRMERLPSPLQQQSTPGPPSSMSLPIQPLASTRVFWRDGGAAFNAIVMYSHVCLGSDSRITPLFHRDRGPGWEPLPPAANQGTHLLHQDSGSSVDPAPGSRKILLAGASLLTVRPHGRNIAHAFVEAHWLSLHVLRHVADGTVGRHLAGFNSLGRLRSVVVHEDFPFDVATAVNHSSWNVGILAAAVIAAGLEYPVSLVKHHPSLCFERLIAVGTSRDLCAEPRCRKILSTPRDDTFRWVNKLARFGGAVSNPAIRVAIYLRENMNRSTRARRMVGTNAFAYCVRQALEHNIVWADTEHHYNESFLFRRSPVIAMTAASLGPKRNASSSIPVEIVPILDVPRSWGGQAALWASIDVLIAAAGAANTNAIFMPRSSAVIVLAPCSMGHLSWAGTTRQPDQDLVTFKLCSRPSQNITFDRPPGGGIRARCPVLHRLKGGRLKMPLMQVVRMMVLRSASGRDGSSDSPAA